jgi:hypothetical protein
LPTLAAQNVQAAPCRPRKALNFVYAGEFGKFTTTRLKIKRPFDF